MNTKEIRGLLEENQRQFDLISQEGNPNTAMIMLGLNNAKALSLLDGTQEPAEKPESENPNYIEPIEQNNYLQTMPDCADKPEQPKPEQKEQRKKGNCKLIYNKDTKTIDKKPRCPWCNDFHLGECASQQESQSELVKEIEEYEDFILEEYNDCPVLKGKSDSLCESFRQLCSKLEQAEIKNGYNQEIINGKDEVIANLEQQLSEKDKQIENYEKILEFIKDEGYTGGEALTLAEVAENTLKENRK